MRRVYFDNSATTPVLPEVLEAMRPYFGERFGNASSIHHYGQETRAAVEAARSSVAGLLGCRPSEVVFTSGGTEADNLAIFGTVGPGDHVITSAVEHHAVLNACKHLESQGCTVTYLPSITRAGSTPATCGALLAANDQVGHHHDGEQRNRRHPAGRGHIGRSLDDRQPVVGVAARRPVAREVLDRRGHPGRAAARALTRPPSRPTAAGSSPNERIPTTGCAGSSRGRVRRVDEVHAHRPELRPDRRPDPLGEAMSPTAPSAIAPANGVAPSPMRVELPRLVVGGDQERRQPEAAGPRAWRRRSAPGPGRAYSTFR